MDLWRTEISDWFPDAVTIAQLEKKTCFGGLYQLLTLTKG